MSFPKTWAAGDPITAQDLNDDVWNPKHTYGETLSPGDALYLKASDGKVYKADADDPTTCKAFVGFCMTAGVANDTNYVCGIGKLITGLSSLTKGSLYYLSNTAGGISTSPGTNRKVVGLAVSTTTLLVLNADPFKQEDIYGTGVDGTLNVTSGTTTLNPTYQIMQYDSFNVSVGASFTPGSNYANKVTIIKVQGDCTIAGTLDWKGKGGTKGSGGSGSPGGDPSTAGAGTAGTVGEACFDNTAGGGGGAASGVSPGRGGGGGGGGGYATAGSAGSVGGGSGGAAGSAGGARSALFAVAKSFWRGAIFAACGNGGGGGGGGNGTLAESNTGGDGGNGGGCLILLVGGTFTLTGTVDVRGDAGSNGATSSLGNNGGGGGGGGGSGGAFFAMYNTAGTISGTVSYTGGAGGSGGAGHVLGSSGGSGGTGGDGEYSTGKYLGLH